MDHRIGTAGCAATSTVWWAGLLAPAGTPPEVIAKVRDEVTRIVQLPDVRARFEALLGEPVGGTPDEFAALMHGDIAEWRRVVDQAGIKAD